MRIIITKKGSVIFKEFNDNKVLNNSMNDNSNFIKDIIQLAIAQKSKILL